MVGELKLVGCDPYKARLTPWGCVKRYETARRAIPKTGIGNGAILRSQTLTTLALCVGCPMGRSRSKSEV